MGSYEYKLFSDKEHENLLIVYENYTDKKNAIRIQANVVCIYDERNKNLRFSIEHNFCRIIEVKDIADKTGLLEFINDICKHIDTTNCLHSQNRTKIISHFKNSFIFAMGV